VKIMDLARDMIRFSKLEPDKDIAIEIIGPRPGEKLHEELFNPYERPEPTPAAKILRADRAAIDPAWVQETFDEISLLVLEGDAAGLAAKVAELAAARAALAAAAEPAPEPASENGAAPSEAAETAGGRLAS
jgi:FlaA1/EpsC-like NDP-sugar epimerase